MCLTELVGYEVVEACRQEAQAFFLALSSLFVVTGTAN